MNRKCMTEFEREIENLRSKVKAAAFAGQATMNVPMSLLLGIIGRSRSWAEKQRLQSANAELTRILHQTIRTMDASGMKGWVIAARIRESLTRLNVAYQDKADES